MEKHFTFESGVKQLLGKARILKGLITFLLLFSASVSIYGKEIEINGIRYSYNSYYDGNRATVISRPEGYSGEITIPSTITVSSQTYRVTSIQYSAFSGCSGLTSITIPLSVTSIGNSAFSGCSGLTSITIPSSVTSIGSTAFSGCSGLISITIPSSVTSIESGTFMGCSGLTSIAIPENVISISGYTFRDCTSLTSVTIPENVISIGAYTFQNCTSLTSITIPAGVTLIGDCAFRDCSSLTSIIIPESVTSVGDYVFDYCENLLSIYVYSNSPIEGKMRSRYKEKVRVWEIESSWPVGLRFALDSINASCKVFGYVGSDQGINIPETITVSGRVYNVSLIRNSAFKDCSELAFITIPNGVTTIKKSVFEGCSGLVAITFPSTITIVGNQMLKGCDKLKYILWHNENDKFDNNVFDQKIYDNATLFVHKGGKSLLPGFYKVVEFENDFYDIYLGGLYYSLDIIKRKATLVKSFYPGNVDVHDTIDYKGKTFTVTAIDSMAFEYGESVTTLSIPTNVDTIGHNVLSTCLLLDSLTIHGSSTFVKKDAFVKLDKLRSICATSTVPCPFDDYACTAAQYLDDITIYVPNEAVDAYMNAPGWRNFFNVNGYEPTAIDDVIEKETTDISVENGQIVIRNAKGNVSVYALSGKLVKRVRSNGGQVRVDVPSRGIYVIKTANGVTKVAL